MNTIPDSDNRHIVKDFDDALTRLRRHAIAMGHLVAEQVEIATKAMLERNGPAARRVLEHELRINEYDTDIAAEAFRLLLRRAPVAVDLRIIIAIGRTALDLERAGDEARNIARAALEDFTLLGTTGTGVVDARLLTMARFSAGMMRAAVAGLERGDPAIGEHVARLDEELDREFRSAMEVLIAPSTTVASRPAAATIRDAYALKSLERIGDHARSVAAHAVFLVRADDTRHRRCGSASA